MVLRRLCWLVAVLAASTGGAAARDFLPLEHGLRYVGREGMTPVTVEVTLNERPDGDFDYVQWVMPRGWATWFVRPATTKARLRYRDERLVSLGLEDPDGMRSPPANLAPDCLDKLAIRLRARADIAQGVRRAEYTVWGEGDLQEAWILEVSGAESVQTPDGLYQALKFRLGSDTEWIEGWSAPLLIFHFVKIVHWRDGKKITELRLDDKQL